MTPRRTALLLDTGFSALPIYEYLRGLDLDLWVMGNRGDDVIARLAGERWIQQDYSRVEAVRDHIRQRGIDYVIPGCTDVSIETCAKLLEFEAIDTIEAHYALSNKQEFRRLCAATEAPAPSMFALDDFPKAGQFICKPVDLFSGKGITVFDGLEPHAPRLAVQSAQSASPSGEVVIEQFITGQLHSYTAFIEAGEVVDAFVVKEGSSSNRFAVDTSYVDTEFASATLDILQSAIERICSRLSLKDGLLHTQFILSEEGPFLIEATRRCPGDLYALLIEYSTGYRYAAKYASYFIGEKLSAEASLSAGIVRHTVSSAHGCINAGLRMNDRAALRAYYPLQRMGETLLPAQKSRAGILFAEASPRAELDKLFETFIAREAYVDGN